MSGTLTEILRLAWGASCLEDIMRSALLVPDVVIVAATLPTVLPNLQVELGLKVWLKIEECYRMGERYGVVEGVIKNGKSAEGSERDISRQESR